MHRFMKFSGLLVILLAGALSPVLYRKTLGYFDASAAASQQDKDKVNCPRCAPPRDRIIYLPLIDLPEAQSAELVFNSRSPKEMEVTPTFYKVDGTAVVADPVRLKSNEIRYVDLKKLIPGPYRNDANWGGMSLAFSGMPREIWAQLRFLGINGGASVDEFFSVPTEVRSDVQEAVWWMPPVSTAVLALGNITNVATSATVRFGDGQEQAVALAPHATHIIRRAPRSQAGPESVLITITGAPGSVIPAGLIASANGAFNSAIRFYETRRAKQPDLFGNGLRLDGATPRMVLKNTSSVMITATPQFIPLRGVGGGRSVVLPSLALKPQETVEVDLGLLIKLAQDRKDLATVSVAVANSGAPGSLIGALYSSNTATGISYDVPLRDSGPVRNMTGAYPWKIDKDFTTMVHITNISNGLAEFVGEINCDGGKYLIEPRTLAAGETAVFDLREIVEGQKPDKLNRRLPANATVGQFRWTLRGVAGGKVILMGRAEMVSRAGRISSSYSCAGDCIAEYVGSLRPDYPEMIVDDQITFTAMETAFYADGYHMGPYPVSPQGLWSTDSPNAVEVNEIGTCTALSPTPQAIIRVTIRQVERFNWMEETQECVGDGDFYDEVGETVVTVQTGVAKIQYQSDSTFTDISGTLYVLRGTSVTFKAIPKPANATWPSGKPVWGGTAGASGTGETKSVTFNTASSSTSDFKTVTAESGNTITVNVLVYDLTGISTPQDNFTGRSTTRYGLAEVINLSFTATPAVTATQAGGLKWKIAGGGGTITAADDGTGTYTAPDAPGSATLKLEILNGPSKSGGPSYNRSIIAPSGVYTVQQPNTGIRHTNGKWSVGFLGDTYLLPNDVSFSFIETREADVEAVATGFLNVFNRIRHGDGIWASPGSCNASTGCKVLVDRDEIWSGELPPTFYAGDFLWAIPRQYRVNGGAATNFTTVNHHATSDANGRACIEKGGAGPFCKNPGDPTSSW